MMNEIIQQDQVSSYSVAALLHKWGVTPKVKSPRQIDFSFDGYEFSCVVNEETLLLHFGDVAFKDIGSDILLSEVQAELGSIQKRIGHNFASLSAFYTKKNEVGIEFIAVVPIVSYLVIDHLHFTLKHFLTGSLKVLGILKNQGYKTFVNYILSDAKKPVNKKPSKRDLCFSCEGKGQYGNGRVCSICHGSGEHPELAAEKKREAQVNTKRVQSSSHSRKANNTYAPSYVDYGDSSSESYTENNTMHDDNLCDYSAEMGNDGDDY
ncbi:hypothetical protein A134_23405 [Vibrio crassostreae 9CS106]|uniref:Uncharacterized protein n=1 Tax=Vibrio crassostreae 9CS106 TaxID=1191300 RepID=A0A1B1C3H2_9VIBR|nr:hypothetical protein [Vibrio sp. F13]ANP79269.1 hypothetical protein A134_23405 [Vibrio crassostreae 9CS106]TKG34016.1 hypothetical protein FCV85_07675 [Vibrio sp. F13]